MTTRFPILFTGANKAMAVLGITQGSSYVEVDDPEVRVRMSWAAPRRWVDGELGEVVDRDGLIAELSRAR